ncbi:MAG TPA: prolyl oligopeptidase family serine peptidase [Bacteroidales bacterium]|nr:prolyl oligopeptidase family serine peptidase [Bacteroidales bacterium]
MDKKRLFNVLILIICILSFFIILFRSHEKTTGKPKVRYDYLLYLPDEYQKEWKKDFPLVIFLHGASLRGNDLNLLKKYGIPRLIDRGDKFDFIIASPQCPPGKYWDTENWFDNLHAELTSKYRVDTNRIYLTGMSMGGFGTWNTAMEYPQKFAAIVPVCGGGDVKNICKIKHVPVWAFHGTADPVIPFNRSERLVNKLLDCNGIVQFTRLEGEGHEIQWIYEDREIYNWMLMHRKPVNLTDKQ